MVHEVGKQAPFAHDALREHCQYRPEDGSDEYTNEATLHNAALQLVTENADLTSRLQASLSGDRTAEL